MYSITYETDTLTLTIMFSLVPTGSGDMHIGIEGIIDQDGHVFKPNEYITKRIDAAIKRYIKMMKEIYEEQNCGL